ncbi:unnamed protein product [Lactuca virosa]|uniref:Uncharacterized protein n=1 Tax=Lactuca virosa TaxID=75947 RepID=A0AAU9PKE2_9ASTR|nr:unnamed protein product [Lactuca virosa]
MQVFLKCKSDRATNMFKVNKCIWLKWFVWMDHVDLKFTRFERIDWLKLLGCRFKLGTDHTLRLSSGVSGWSTSVPFGTVTMCLTEFVTEPVSDFDDGLDYVDGVSDTWQPYDVEIEKGEFNPNGSGYVSIDANVFFVGASGYGSSGG